SRGDNQVAVGAKNQHCLFELVEQALEISELLTEQVHLGHHHTELIFSSLQLRHAALGFVLPAGQMIQHLGYVAQGLEGEIGEDQRDQDRPEDREQGDYNGSFQLRQYFAADQRRKDHNTDEQDRTLPLRSQSFG